MGIFVTAYIKTSSMTSCRKPIPLVCKADKGVKVDSLCDPSVNTRLGYRLQFRCLQFRWKIQHASRRKSEDDAAVHCVVNGHMMSALIRLSFDSSLLRFHWKPSRDPLFGATPTDSITGCQKSPALFRMGWTLDVLYRLAIDVLRMSGGLKYFPI
jgi:hypothetical protein